VQKIDGRLAADHVVVDGHDIQPVGPSAFGTGVTSEASMATSPAISAFATVPSPL
jgi:hypothetical protein